MTAYVQGQERILSLGRNSHPASLLSRGAGSGPGRRVTEQCPQEPSWSRKGVSACLSSCPVMSDPSILWVSLVAAIPELCPYAQICTQGPGGSQKKAILSGCQPGLPDSSRNDVKIEFY